MVWAEQLNKIASPWTDQLLSRSTMPIWRHQAACAMIYMKVRVIVMEVKRLLPWLSWFRLLLVLCGVPLFPFWAKTKCFDSKAKRREECPVVLSTWVEKTKRRQVRRIQTRHQLEWAQCGQSLRQSSFMLKIKKGQIIFKILFFLKREKSNENLKQNIPSQNLLDISVCPSNRRR